MSFSNIEKAMSAAKISSQAWFSKISDQSFEHEMQDLVNNYSWPTPKTESWKYTNITQLADVDFNPTSKSAPKELPQEWQKFLNDDFEMSLVFFNGEFCSQFSRLSQNLSISFDHLSKSSKNLKDFRLKANSSVEKMNQVLLTDVLRLEVKKSAVIEKPILVLFLSDVSSQQIQGSRLQVILEENAQANIFEIHSGMGTEQISHNLSNHMAEFKIENSARLEHSFLNLNAKGTNNFLVKKFELARASFLRSLHIDLGGGLSRTETYVQLNQSGAEAFVNGLYLNNEKQHTDHQGVIQHHAPETTSHQKFKGILADQSRAIFNAKIRIEQTAPKSSAEQLNKNLLLSEKAEIDSLPRLEIFNDDVKAAHGSTSGQIDPAHIFYLQSRAISKDQALQMLVEGYALEMLMDCEVTVASKIRDFISQKLSQFKVQSVSKKEVEA